MCVCVCALKVFATHASHKHIHVLVVETLELLTDFYRFDFHDWLLFSGRCKCTFSIMTTKK